MPARKAKAADPKANEPGHFDGPGEEYDVDAASEGRAYDERGNVRPADGRW